MKEKRLYIIYGTGDDRVGLVEQITAPLAKAGANIVDLRQDVLHGLFSIFLVVDCSDTTLRIEFLKGMVDEMAEDTGLSLRVAPYSPRPRNPEKKNLLCVFIGIDSPGIIASVSDTLRNYSINIELAQMISRENIFLMELLTDSSTCSIPLENLRVVLSDTMKARGIQTIIHHEDVFTKKKRILLFHFTHSLLSPGMLSELMKLTGISANDFHVLVSRDNPYGILSAAASLLDRMPLDVLRSVTDGIRVTSGSVELLQTLKLMGYTVVCKAHAFSCYTDVLQTKLGLDNVYGVPLAENDDLRAVMGDVPCETPASVSLDAVIEDVCRKHGVARNDVTIIDDSDYPSSPGISMTFDLQQMLDMYNNHVLTRQFLVGLTAGCGVPRLPGIPSAQGGENA